MSAKGGIMPRANAINQIVCTCKSSHLDAVNTASFPDFLGPKVL